MNSRYTTGTMPKKLIVLILFFVIVSAITSSLITATIINKNTTSAKNELNEVNKIEQKYASLNKLSVDVQLSYIKQILGNPIIVNFAKDRSQKELIYIDDDFYTQVIANNDDKVLAYAVTTRNENFKPKLPNQAMKVTLGTSTFNSLGDTEPMTCYAFLGNTAASYYFEQYNFGRIGGYLDYFVGINDLGYLDENLQGSPIFDANELRQAKESSLADCSLVTKDSRNAVINTYIVSMLGPNEYHFSFGVDRNSIIAIPNTD